MNEIWKDIEEYEGYYQISNFGTVRALKRKITRSDGVVLTFKKRNKKPTIDTNGYLKVNLCKNGELSRKYIHRLIAKSFIPNPHKKRCINHKDGVKTNNHITNLEWCSYSENHIHAYKNGLNHQNPLRGEEAPTSKLTKNEVLEIRAFYPLIDIRYTEIAKSYNVSRVTISNIIKQRSWTHV